MTVRGYTIRECPEFPRRYSVHYRCKNRSGFTLHHSRRGAPSSPSGQPRHPSSWDCAPVSRWFRINAPADWESPWETASNFNRRNPWSLCTIAWLRPAILRRSCDDLTTRHDKSKPTDCENGGNFAFCRYRFQSELQIVKNHIKILLDPKTCLDRIWPSSLIYVERFQSIAYT